MLFAYLVKELGGRKGFASCCHKQVMGFHTKKQMFTRQTSDLNASIKLQIIKKIQFTKPPISKTPFIFMPSQKVRLLLILKKAAMSGK